MSTANPSPGGIQEIDWLAAETRELLQQAEQQARHRGSQAIYPEHLLLSLIEQPSNTITLLIQQSKLDLIELRRHIETSFPIMLPSAELKELSLAPESVACIEQAIALVTYHLSGHKAKPMVLPRHLLLSIFYQPRMQRLFSSFSTTIFTIKNRLAEQENPGFIRHMEQVFLFSEQEPTQNVVQLAQLAKERNKHILRSIEYPDLTFQQIAGLSQAKQAVQDSIGFLRRTDSYQERSYGLLLLGQHLNDDILFIRAIAGEAGVPLSIISCSAIVEIFLANERLEHSIQAERAEKAYQLIREVFYPIRIFSHCLIYFQDLEVLAVPALGQQQRYHGWRYLQQQFLIELDKLKQQRGTVVIAATTHPQHLHADFLRPGRLDKPVELYKPVELLREEQKQPGQALTQAICPTCHSQVQSHWKHCVYCRTLLTKRCKSCGTPYPELVGARFCSECGSDL